ncbi:hypothetical protein EIL87_24270 [Saccharopolyspora rhizosphaerae]|uniref:DUF1129 family protein n=1 Tax=Saccharopolyspora rhizosphaerae TaxID=2492662 RepID=A0A3R8PXZ7_9PSEU|nr:hypothetical protein [Saccharopolyspora rhizosphaerae]RRO12804.1 hypothetical protein EIL87_24270 [Saccharopolyspora rhizosphaerae]
MMVLDRKYHDDLLIALRMHEVSGERVGEVLAEVESHVAETGEDPVEAFGEPRDYARRVAAQLDRSTGKRPAWEVVLGSLVAAVLAFFGSTFLVRGLAAGEEGVIFTVRDVVAQPLVLLLVVAGTALVFRAFTALAHAKSFAGGAVVAFVALIASQTACALYLDDVTPVITVPSGVVLVLGVVLLVVLAAVLGGAVRRGRVRYPAKA